MRAKNQAIIGSGKPELPMTNFSSVKAGYRELKTSHIMGLKKQLYINPMDMKHLASIKNKGLQSKILTVFWRQKKY